LPAAAGVTAVAVLDLLGGPLEHSDLAHPGYELAVPLHPELEVLVGVEALRIDAELNHVDPSLGQRASDLLDLQHDELRRAERREADDDVDPAEVPVVDGGGLRVTLDEVGIPRAASLD